MPPFNTATPTAITPVPTPAPCSRRNMSEETRSPSSVDPPASSGIDASAPHSARIWNYSLGGKDNYAIGRTFLARAVEYLVEDAAIDAFLDIVTGLPTAENAHQVAHRHDPSARVVYVDNAPLVLSHARALLTSSPPHRPPSSTRTYTTPKDILPDAATTPDLTRPWRSCSSEPSVTPRAPRRTSSYDTCSTGWSPAVTWP